MAIKSQGSVFLGPNMSGIPDGSLFAVALTVELGPSSLYRTAEIDPIALALDGARISTLAVGVATLQTAADVPVKVEHILSACVAPSVPYDETVEKETIEDFLALLQEAEAPIFAIWKKSFDLAFLRTRAIRHKIAVSRLDRAMRLDLSELLFPEGRAPSLERSMAALGLGVPEDIQGQARVELLAAGTIGVTLLALWEAGAIDLGPADAAARNFDAKISRFASTEPHFRIWGRRRDGGPAGRSRNA